MTNSTALAPVLKERALRLAHEAERTIVDLSHRIHAHPELCFEEIQASRWCLDALDAQGFAITAGVCDLPTAFRASIGSGPLGIGICAEYDALPGIGHACGHNVIAAAAIGAAIALKPLVDDLGITLHILGTPAEEGGGGKILMLERDGFAGVDAAMMVHPWPTERVQMPCLAVSHFDVRYHGVEAHASAFPELGINAADAITVAQVAIGLLRQHSVPGDQVHGIVTHGGDAPNIVPAFTEAKYYVRASTLARLAEWLPRVEQCFRAGSIATGAEVEFVSHGAPYSEFRTDTAMAACYRANAEAIGRHFAPDEGRVIAASTDMANVSLAFPAIHPTLDIDSLPAVNHQAAFAAHCVKPAADKACIDGAVAMAWTVIDLGLDNDARARLRVRG